MQELIIVDLSLWARFGFAYRVFVVCVIEKNVTLFALGGCVPYILELDPAVLLFP